MMENQRPGWLKSNTPSRSDFKSKPGESASPQRHFLSIGEKITRSQFLKYIVIVSIILIGTLNGLALEVEAGTSQEDLGVQIADSIIQRWPNPLTLTTKGWEYNNGIILHGIEKIYKNTGDIRYLDYIKNWVDYYIETNRLRTENLDHIQPGMLLLFLYEETGEDKYWEAAVELWSSFKRRPRNEEGGFWHKTRYPEEMWLDGIYMGGPFLAKYGYLFNDSTAIDEAVRQTTLIASRVLNEETGLLYHAWDYDKNASWADPINGLSPEVWSRGMGWYMMALVDILTYLQPTHPGYQELINILQKAAKGVKDCQDPSTGLWYQVMDKGQIDGNWLETSGSGMFVYALTIAVRQGYIDQSYLGIAVKGWTGLVKKIVIDYADRLVVTDAVEGMGVQAGFEQYITKRRLSNSPHGYCGMLMAASVMGEE